MAQESTQGRGIQTIDTVMYLSTNRSRINRMPIQKGTLNQIAWPLFAGLTGILFISSLYFGLVSWGESPSHALALFWEERLIVIPLFVGFGIQMAIYIILKKGLFSSSSGSSSTGMIPGASGTTSTVAMAACCAHHVTDVLPILGLSTASAFLAEYQTIFMLIGLATTYLGIAVLIYILHRERSQASKSLVMTLESL